MQLTTTAFEDGGWISTEHAFAESDPEAHATFSPNRNPDLAWEDVPDGTRSFVLICHDPHAPTRPDDVNQEDREIPSDLPRADFYHWVLVDIPADVRSIAEGEHCDGVTPGGKEEPPPIEGARHGLNDYTGWFSGDPDMEGKYRGYDGPCPPWNDSIVHDYVFTLYALDIDRVPVEGDFTGDQVRDAIEGHVLAEASVTGRYTTTPRLLP
jgi:Raf kinase inhibitor-like YbhB/YbcL family protein